MPKYFPFLEKENCKMFENNRKKENTFLSCIMYKFHNSYFVYVILFFLYIFILFIFFIYFVYFVIFVYFAMRVPPAWRAFASNSVVSAFALSMPCPRLPLAGLRATMLLSKYVPLGGGAFKALAACAAVRNRVGNDGFSIGKRRLAMVGLSGGVGVVCWWCAGGAKVCH